MSIRFLPLLLSALALTGTARAASIFTTQRPASGDSSPNARSVELGVRFRADAAGQITGLRFYKIAGNTGAHTGHLWTNTGVLLGSLTFTGETATGWQTASFAAPIAIQAGTTYVASYHTAAFYAVTRQTFATAGIDNPPLHALRDGVSGPNGAYAYASGAVFPSQGTRSSNYWVDVVFTTSGPDVTPPTVTISSPAAGAAVRGTVAVLAAASDDVAVTTVQFKLDGAPLGPADLLAPYAATWNTTLSAGGAHVLAAVAWDAAGNASTSAAVSVTVDNAPPVIGAVAVANVGSSSAAVSWTTDEPASSQVEYGTSTAYGSFTPLAASPVTSHARTLTGLTAGTQYHYRVRSADAAGNLAVSGDGAFTTSSPPPAPVCRTSAGAWMNFPFPPMSGFFVAEFDATPHAANMDGVMGLSNGPASSFAQLADIVRFNTAGFIDARDGGAYAAVGPIPYSPGTGYHFTLEVDLASHTYTAYVSSPSAARQLVGSRFAFRTEQSAVSVLDNMGFIADIGSATVCGVSVFSDTVPPTVAISSPLAGALIAGSAAVTAAAFDGVAVATVQFRLDGAALGAPDFSPPYAAVWNTALSADGAHSLTAVAWDAAGNASTSAAVSVAVDNTPPVIGAVSVANMGQSSVSVTWTTSEPATSQVEFGTTTSYGSFSALDPSTAVGHARILSGLAIGTTYHYRVRSGDAAGNLSVSADDAFTVVFVGTPTVVSLTFDDGTISQLLARDMLDQKGVKGTFYVNSGRIGAGPAFMDLSQIRSIAAGGHEIGGHTVDHLDVTTLTPEQLRHQICDDRTALVALGFNAASLAYPFGAYDGAAESMAASCGYKSARGVGGLGCSGCPKAIPLPPPDAFALPTPDSIRSSTTLAAMQQMVSDAEQAGGGWVPIVMHRVCDGCDPLSVSSGTLGAFIDWVKPRAAAGTVIRTMAEVMGADIASPSVAVSSPAAGSVAAGTVTVTAAAFDGVAVAAVQFKLDGAALGPADAAAPYAFAWDTASSSDGPHSLSAVAWDAAGNPSTSAAVSVTVDNTPPLISSVAAVDVGIDSATIVWTTGEPATAQVEFGTTAAYGSLAAPDSSTATVHARILGGLSAGTAYHYRVRSADAAGNLAVSGDLVFSTLVVPDLTPPAVEISSPAGGTAVAGTVPVAAAAFDGVAVATVQFRLDGEDLGLPDAAAPYGLDWNTALSSDGPHGLSAVAWDASGNASTAAVVPVIVDNAPPLIGSAAVKAVGIDYAAVAWITDEPATSQVEYGTSTAYGGLTALDASTSAAHDVFLGGLSTGTLYHYRVRSVDAAGNLAASADADFTTAVAPSTASFFDDFSAYAPDLCLADGELFGPWTSVFNGYGCISVRSDGERFWLEESPFASASSSETHAALVSGLSFASPMTLSVDVRTTAQLRTNAPPNPWEAAWVVWNYADNARFYYFIPKPDGWELGKADPAYPGGQRFLTTGSSPVFPIGGTYHVKIVQSQNVLSAYVDGVLITTFTDAQRPYTSGRISLYTEDAAARFTNVAVNVATPTVSILSPQGGAFLAGTVAVTAAAFDDVAVATVQFRLDGADLGPPDNAAPYTAAWATAVSSEGGHSLTALAWDADGNASTSAAVSVTVDNTAPVASSVVVSDLGTSSATIAWITDEPSTSRVDYGTSAAYGSSTAPDASAATAHSLSIGGLSAGTLYHYRVVSADAAGNLASSDDRTLATASSDFGCMTSAGVWRNEAFPPQVSSFTVSFDVRPSSAGMEASVGLSSGAAGSLADLAAGVRFNSQGFIDVRYSTSYARMSTVAYSTGTTYRFDLRVNASAHVFDAYVTPQGSSRVLLARNYTFRSEQSTGTSLDNIGLLASSGAATMCNLTVSASTVPWWDGIRELYATAAGSKTWYSTWDNGIDRSFVAAKDPTDPWFDAAHGAASYIVDAASGVFKISGEVPRMYIHHPVFVQGSTSLNVAQPHEKQWHDVEMTVYGMRVADSTVAWAGIDGVARANHGITGPETRDLCDSRGIGSRFRLNGHLDFEKETRHPAAYAVANTTTTLWPSDASMPYNVWIGFKYAVYDLPNGNVKVESYMDMTNGAGGGTWILVNQFEDDGTNWGGGTGCRSGVNPRERLTNSSNRPGSESGLPNVSVYFRSDGVGVNGLLYKKMSVREIVAPAGGAGPLAAAGAGTGPGAAPAAAEEAFLFRDLYAFPNPSRRGERVTIRLQAGVADEVDVDIFDLSGRRVNGGVLAGPVLLDDGNGKGAQYTYDFHWDVRGAASAVYLYSVNARKQGQPAIGRTGKVALIK